MAHLELVPGQWRVDTQSIVSRSTVNALQGCPPNADQSTTAIILRPNQLAGIPFTGNPSEITINGALVANTLRTAPQLRFVLDPPTQTIVANGISKTGAVRCNGPLLQLSTATIPGGANARHILWLAGPPNATVAIFNALVGAPATEAPVPGSVPPATAPSGSSPAGAHPGTTGSSTSGSPAAAAQPAAADASTEPSELAKSGSSVAVTVTVPLVLLFVISLAVLAWYLYRRRAARRRRQEQRNAAGWPYGTPGQPRTDSASDVEKGFLSTLPVKVELDVGGDSDDGKDDKGGAGGAQVSYKSGEGAEPGTVHLQISQQSIEQAVQAGAALVSSVLAPGQQKPDGTDKR